MPEEEKRLNQKQHGSEGRARLGWVRDDGTERSKEWLEDIDRKENTKEDTTGVEEANGKHDREGFRTGTTSKKGEGTM